MRYILYILALVVVSSSFLPLEETTDLEASVFDGASISYKVVDLKNKQVIKELNPNLLLAPASTQKIITTSFAIDHLGEDFKFYSTIGIVGAVNNGVLEGDIVFKPNSNPALCNERWGYSLASLASEITRYLNLNKIEKVTGSFILVDSLLEVQTLPRTWIYEDIGNYFGANPSGTMVNENKLALFFTSGNVGEITKIIKTEPKIELVIENRVVSHDSNSDLAYAFGTPGSKTVLVTGGIPANRKNFKVTAALPNPRDVVNEYLSEKLAGFNISNFEIKSRLETKTQSTTKIHVIEIKDVIYQTNQNSVNILAEILKQNIEKTESLSTIFKNDYQTTSSPIFFDGSGLSRFNAVASNHLVKILVKQKNNSIFTESLSVGGVSGTLKNMFAGSSCAGKVSAKSGYMEGVRSYAGYISTSSGKELAFAVIVNNYTGDKYQVRNELKKWIENLYEL